MKNLIFKQIKSEKLSNGEHYEQFSIDSLKVGEGITIGNQLRRVLLSDLEGIAISAIKIIGVNNEYSIIPGVREDILEILLNLKGIICKSDLKKHQLGKLKVKGPAIITADMIQVPSSLNIINPAHYIATISNANILEMEFKFEYGTGYKLAYQTFSNEDINYLQVDAIFMPVKKVEYKIENIYDLDDNITERLNIEIWTNGSILPSEALKLAAKRIIDLFTIFIEVENENEINVEKDSSELNQKEIKSYSEIVEPYTNLSIEELQLSVRPYNCLKKAQIKTIGDLLKYSPKQLLQLRNFGKKSSEEVFSALRTKFGIIFE